jgi:hypothetical protein
MDEIRKIIRKILLISMLSAATAGLLAQEQMTPGSIHPEAVRIDFDLNMPFRDGYAVLYKSNQYAVINSAGEFVVPYHKYSFIEGFSYGRCPATKSIPEQGSRQGFIDESGKEIITFKYLKVHPFTRFGNALATRWGDAKDVLLDRNGKETVLENAPPPGVAGSTFVSRKGIHDKFGKVLVPETFVYHHQFSEGLAAVAKKDEFGATKWGYIDEKGKVVIPFQFSKEPGDFSSGLAYVMPATVDFDYGYIDKTGTLKFKMPRGMARRTGQNSWGVTPMPFNATGFAISGITKDHTEYLIDTQGKFISVPQLTTSNEISFNPKGIHIESIDVDYFLVRTQSGMMVVSLMGLIVVPPIFSELDYFDPMSHLAPATLAGNSTAGKTLPKGYINQEGVFVIVQKEKSEW